MVERQLTKELYPALHKAQSEAYTALDLGKLSGVSDEEVAK